MNLPPGRTLIQNTNDPRDLNKDYDVQFPVIGDANCPAPDDRGLPRDCRRQPTEQRRGHRRDRVPFAMRGSRNGSTRPPTPARWSTPIALSPTSRRPCPPARPSSPTTPEVPATKSPVLPSGGPRTYLGWGKSHASARVGPGDRRQAGRPGQDVRQLYGRPRPFGMVGLDFETAVRSNVPITTVVLNNSTMAVETNAMQRSHELYNTRPGW